MRRAPYAQICREHELSPNLLATWREAFLSNAKNAFASPKQQSADAGRIAELERAPGQATLENQILKRHRASWHRSAAPHAEQKERKSLMRHVQEARPKVKTAQLCRVFRVPRSSFYRRSIRQEEVQLRKAVEDMAATWPRFGYKCITGQIRFEETREGKGKPIGERRVKRVMKELGLLRQYRAAR